MAAPASVAMTPIYLERREPARNRLRFYAITVTRTLLGSLYEKEKIVRRVVPLQHEENMGLHYQPIYASMNACIHKLWGDDTVPANSENPSAPSGRAPSRVGKKGVTVYLEPDVVKQLRGIGLNEDKTLQALMIEAVNMLFKNRGKETSQ